MKSRAFFVNLAFALKYKHILLERVRQLIPLGQCQAFKQSLSLSLSLSLSFFLSLSVSLSLSLSFSFSYTWTHKLQPPNALAAKKQAGMKQQEANESHFFKHSSLSMLCCLSCFSLFLLYFDCVFNNFWYSKFFSHSSKV